MLALLLARVKIQIKLRLIKTSLGDGKTIDEINNEIKNENFNILETVEEGLFPEKVNIFT